MKAKTTPFLGALAFLVLAPFFVLDWGASARTTWIVALIGGAGLLISISAVTKKSLLTDERGRWSLSRLQLLLWTWFILSTLWAIVVVRLHADVRDPLAVELDKNLWLLLGINASSFVGSSLILARKADKPGLLAVRNVTAGVNPGGLSDLFTGEDTGNTDVIDIGRVQMFFFTVVALVVFGAATAKAMGSTSVDQIAFPQVSESLVALLGISHSAYLANKIPERPPVPTPTT